MSLTLLLLGLACQGDRSAADADVEPVPVRLVHAAGVRRAELVGWAEGAPRLADGVAEDWLAVRLPRAGDAADAAFEAWAGGGEDGDRWRLELAGGGSLPGEPTVTASGAPAWRLAGVEGAAPMPFDTLWLKGLARGLWPAQTGDEDEVWIRTDRGVADRHRGYLLGWEAGGLVFESVTGERRFAWDDVLALRVFEEQIPVAADAVWIQFAHGGHLSARPVALDGRTLEVELPWGARWRVPLEEVRRLRRRDGVAELADGGWQVERQPDAAVVDWSPKVGRSVEGRALRLADDVYAQGIGVRVPTTLARPVDGAGTLFATVGVDRAVRDFRAPQPVTFEILLDEESLYRSPPLRVDDGARSVLVTVPRAGRLRLVARPAGVLPFGGHADWCDLLWLPSAGAERP